MIFSLVPRPSQIFTQNSLCVTLKSWEGLGTRLANTIIIFSNSIVPAVYLSLGGRIYTSNNSYVNVDDIGEGDDGALLCITDLLQCCRTSDIPGTEPGGALEEWYYPNGTNIPIEGDSYDFYHNRGRSVVRLNHRNSTSARPTTGLYCCVVPDATTTQ